MLLRVVRGTMRNPLAAPGCRDVARGIIRAAADVTTCAGVGLGVHVRRENFNGVVNTGNGEKRFVGMT